MSTSAPDPSAAELRNLPSVDTLLNHPSVVPLLDEFPRGELLRCVRGVLDGRRAALRAGRDVSIDGRSLALDIRESLYARSRPHLRRVINATGIVLHTGLGRAPLADSVVDAVAEIAAGYSNLELDLADGTRGNRQDHARNLLCELTGAEAAMVVNNNAAGTFLALHGLTAGREVIVSRGQLVEIGGSYRMPDIMAAAGCRMVEVGTTNRTHLGDYQRAIGDETAALLHVHTSNYRIEGFTTMPSVGELVGLARGANRNLPVIDDLGSGLLIAPDANAAENALPRLMAPWDEPSVPESLAAGADLVLFSGDKLLGGPQAGLIVGRRDLIAALQADPLARAFRPGKLTLAALEATLRLYRDPQSLVERLPVMRMLISDIRALQERATRLAELIRRACPALTVDCRQDESFAGGGSLPTLPFATWVVIVRRRGVPAEQAAAGLRERETPIIARVRDDALWFDCRTIADDELDQIGSALGEAAASSA